MIDYIRMIYYPIRAEVRINSINLCTKIPKNCRIIPSITSNI